MGETLSPVIPTFNRSLRVESRTDRLTGDPGAVVLREVLERSGIVSWMTSRLSDRRSRVDVTHDLASLIRTSVLLAAQGWRDHDDADALRHDPAFRLATSSAAGLTPLEGPGLASQPTLSRFTAVMAERASTDVTPNGDELARMRAHVRDAMQAGAVGFASSFSPNHFGYAGAPMPSTIATIDELRALVEAMAEDGRGVFMMATGTRATLDDIEALAEQTGRPMFISTVMTMYNAAAPERGIAYYERCARAIERGREVYIQTSCQPLSFDFTLRDPYLLYSHDAFDRVKSADPKDLPAIYADPEFRKRFRQNLAEPKQGILFNGDFDTVELDGRPITSLASQLNEDPLDWMFDTVATSGIDLHFIAKLFQNDDRGVAPILRHPAGVIALSDAGAHLVYLCDAGFGLHFLAHWVRETGTFSLSEAVHRLTDDPARKFRIPDRGRIVPGAWADLLLFDPATVGVSAALRVADLPGGGERIIRKPLGVAGVWVNGVQIFDGKNTVTLETGPGSVLDRFDA